MRAPPTHPINTRSLIVYVLVSDGSQLRLAGRAGLLLRRCGQSPLDAGGHRPGARGSRRAHPCRPPGMASSSDPIEAPGGTDHRDGANPWTPPACL
jgi:hypothetical protein